MLGYQRWEIIYNPNGEKHVMNFLHKSSKFWHFTFVSLPIPLPQLKKQGPQGPQKLSSLKSLRIKTPNRYRAISLLQSSEMAYL